MLEKSHLTYEAPSAAQIIFINLTFSFLRPKINVMRAGDIPVAQQSEMFGHFAFLHSFFSLALQVVLETLLFLPGAFLEVQQLGLKNPL